MKVPLLRFVKPWVACALLAAAMSPSARAEVWGFIDARGVAHFAAEKADERYELFFRGGESFDTARGLGPAPAKKDSARAVVVPGAAPKLIAFFEISPSFKQVKHHLREASRAQDIDYELLKALIATESGFDARAVSPKGAVGLMQVMPATAQRYGVTGDVKVAVGTKLADPRTNLQAGTRYLRYLLDLFPGRLDLALAAYNAGEGAVQRAGNQIPKYRETQDYVATVMQLSKEQRQAIGMLETDTGSALVLLQRPEEAVESRVERLRRDERLLVEVGELEHEGA